MGDGRLDDSCPTTNGSELLQFTIGSKSKDPQITVFAMRYIGTKWKLSLILTVYNGPKGEVGIVRDHCLGYSRVHKVLEYVTRAVVLV